MSRLYRTTDYREAIAGELRHRDLLKRDLARALGRSEGWVSLALQGDRPLPPDLVDGIAAFLGLDPSETAYLAALVDLAGPSPRARRAAWAVVVAMQRRAGSAALTEGVAEALSCWHVAAVAELARCVGFRPDPAWIARTLHPAIAVEDAQDALTQLLRVGLLVPDDAGGLAPGPEAWSAPDLPEGAISDAAARLHRRALELAALALGDFRYNERHQATALIAVPEARFEAVRALVRELEQRIATEASEPGPPWGAPDGPNRVYLLGVQLFPVSAYTDGEP